MAKSILTNLLYTCQEDSSEWKDILKSTLKNNQDDKFGM